MPLVQTEFSSADNPRFLTQHLPKNTQPLCARAIVGLGLTEEEQDMPDSANVPQVNFPVRISTGRFDAALSGNLSPTELP